MHAEIEPRRIQESSVDTRIINTLAAYVGPWLHTPEASESTKAEAQETQRQALKTLWDLSIRISQVGGEFELQREQMNQEKRPQEELDAELIRFLKETYQPAIKARLAKQHFDGTDKGLYFELIRYELLYGIIPRRDIPPSDAPIPAEELTSPVALLEAFGISSPNMLEDIPTEVHDGFYTLSPATETVDTSGRAPAWGSPQYSNQHKDELDQAFALYDESKGDLDAKATLDAFAVFARLYFEDNLIPEMSESEIASLLHTNSEFRRKIIGHYNRTRQTHRLRVTLSSDVSANLDNL